MTVNDGSQEGRADELARNKRAMMGWMSPDTNSYIPRVELGQVMRSSGFGEVVEVG